MSRYLRYEEKDSGYLTVFKTVICNVAATKCAVWVSLKNRFTSNPLARSTKTHSKKRNTINRIKISKTFNYGYQTFVSTGKFYVSEDQVGGPRTL